MCCCSHLVSYLRCSVTVAALTLSPPVGAKGGGDATMPGATDSNVFSSSYKIYGRQWCGITGANKGYGMW